MSTTSITAAWRDLVQVELLEESRPTLSQVSWFNDVLRLTGSTIPRVYRPVLGITLWATFVAVVDIIYGQDWGLTNNVVPLVSVVVALLLVFRNSTAYARWQEGRTLFSNMSNGVRNLARITWCSVGATVWQQGRVDSKGDTVPFRTGEYTEAHRNEKVAALRMMVGFVIASKHHVRGEFGTDHEDLRAVLPASFLTRFQEREDENEVPAAGQDSSYGPSMTTSPSATTPNTVKNKQSVSLTTSPSTLSNNNAVDGQGTDSPSTPSPACNENSPLIERVYHDTVIVHKLHGRPALPLPLSIAHRLQLYFAKCKAQGLLESVGPAGYNAMTTMISQLVNEFTMMERLLTLPLPLVYGIHLKQTVTLYLAVLPLVLVDTMKWKMVPFVTLIAFTLMGIEGIASQIESPFGYDASDLPLDFMGAELRNEIEQMIARLKEVPDEDILF